MTKLRDDGYLETDDPVVAACFLGQEVGFDEPNKEAQLDAIPFDEPFLGCTNKHYIEGDTILIPAATVDEVLREDPKLLYTIVAPLEGPSVSDKAHACLQWLHVHIHTHTHTEEHHA